MGNNEVSIYQSVGARIREERNRKGWSQSKLSEISSISLPHISAFFYFLNCFLGNFGS